MSVDILKLKAAAEAATSGQWVADGEYKNSHGNLLYAYVAHENGGRIAEAFANCLVKTDKQCRANAHFIAAANPPTVLALIAEIERHRQVEAEGCKPDLITPPFFYALRGPDGKPHYDDFCVSDDPLHLECYEDGVTVVPLYTQTDTGEVERLREENLHHRNLQIEAGDLIKSLRAQLAEQVNTSHIREAMENCAAVGAVAELQIGATHVRVTYHGIKWFHDRMIDGQWEPLAIEEFDEILCDSLNRAPAREARND
ncbi:hypothetical protein D3C77_475210 [compost metagenome]